eukprot:4660681-Amphidinium_carterae.1
MALPRSWCKYFAFNTLLSSAQLGLEGPERGVRLGSCVIPMGWKGAAVGLCQYLHRRLVSVCEARTLELAPGPLPLERESRKDK